jgi:hypothetical protein
MRILAVHDSRREDWKMNRNRLVFLLIGLVSGLLLSGRVFLFAQDRDTAARSNPSPAGRQESPTGVQSAPGGPGAAEAVARDATNPVSIQDALLRPYHFPFSRPTPLIEVCAHLKETLKGAVVLDLAALDRQDVEPEDPVQLELDGVRLKTGLKLLLDQVGLTIRVVAEDNLMVITDREGSE